jgi:hypothetical protein
MLRETWIQFDTLVLWTDIAYGFKQLKTADVWQDLFLTYLLVSITNFKSFEKENKKKQGPHKSFPHRQKRI